MKSLSTTELLQTWEEGLDQPLLERMLRLLGKAYGQDLTSISKMSIGERDARLLLLRERLFGKRLKNLANCPKCNVMTEWETSTTRLHLQSLPPVISSRRYDLDKDGYSIQFRLPDSNDMAHAMSTTGKHADSKQLLTKCIHDIHYEGKKISSDELPVDLWQYLDERMSEEDPQADIRMSIVCPACRHQWEARFDIMSYLWAEINNWAHRLMRDVFHLARSFGWSEREILNMSIRRRQLYLQMLGA